MSSSGSNGTDLPVRKGKRALGEIGADISLEEPAAKRNSSDEKVKPPEEEEEVVPVMQKKRGRPKKVSSVAMDVDVDHMKAIESGHASSSKGMGGEGVVETPAKAKAAKPSLKKKTSSVLPLTKPEHWIFDEVSVPHDVLEWVLDWFSRQESCPLRVVCKKWCDIVGLRVLCQSTELTDGNAFLRIPGSRFLGERPCPWADSLLASKIEALNLATSDLLTPGYVPSLPTFSTFPLLATFTNLRHLAVRYHTRLLETLSSHLQNLESLTIYAADETSPLPYSTLSIRFPTVTRLQLAEFNSIRLSALQKLLSHFPAIRALALYKCGLDTPRATTEWIATEYAAVLESLQLDLVPYASTPKVEALPLCELSSLIAMPHLRVLNVYGNDVYRSSEDRSTARDEKGAITYRSSSLESLTLASPNGVRTPITLDMPQLAELYLGNILHLDASECPELETLDINGPFEFANEFFKKHSRRMLQKVVIGCDSRPLQLSKDTKLNLVLPEARSLLCNLGHDQLESISIDTPKLTELWIVMHHSVPQLTIQAPKLEEISLNTSAAILNKIDQQLASFPLLRKKNFINHDLLDMHQLVAPPTYRPLDSELKLLPGSHPSLSSISITSTHRTLASYLGYRNLRSIVMRSIIYEDDLRDMMRAGSSLPHLMDLTIVAPEPSRLDNETTTPIVVDLPSLNNLDLELYRIPQLKFTKKHKYLTNVRLKLQYGARSTPIIQKIDWVSKYLPAIEVLRLEQLKLPTSFNVTSPTLRACQFTGTSSHQSPKIILDCPQLRVLWFQFSCKEIKSFEARLPLLERLELSENLSRYEDEIWRMSDQAQRRRGVSKITEPTTLEPWRRLARQRRGPLGVAGLTPELIMRILLFQERFNQYHNQANNIFHIEDDMDDDDDDDDDDHDHDDNAGDVCPHCGRVHGANHGLFGISDSEDSSDDEGMYGFGF